jgi:hypothetical protein
MSDAFGTVTPKQERARDIERLRRHYKNHRDTLSGLTGDAPSDHLAREYQRIVGEIDAAVRKLDELEGKATVIPPPISADTNPMLRPKTRPGATAPGTRPLVRTEEPPAIAGPGNPRSAVAMIIVAGIVVLAAIAYLIWRPRTNPKSAAFEQPTATATAPPVLAPVTRPALLKIAPAVGDYGTIRKGTRAVRQFEVVNASAAPIELQVARSACRCLFYDYKAKLPANGKETITVTIDGARAKAGALQEQVEVSAKSDPSISATLQVQATIR